jgi:hypothetical protein
MAGSFHGVVLQAVLCVCCTCCCIAAAGGGGGAGGGGSACVSWAVSLHTRGREWHLHSCALSELYQASQCVSILRCLFARHFAWVHPPASQGASSSLPQQKQQLQHGPAGLTRPLKQRECAWSPAAGAMGAISTPANTVPASATAAAVGPAPAQRVCQARAATQRLEPFGEAPRVPPGGGGTICISNPRLSGPCVVVASVRATLCLLL